jgi:hypothetical protein
VLLNIGKKSSLKDLIIAQQQAQRGGASSPSVFYRTLVTQSVGTIFNSAIGSKSNLRTAPHTFALCRLKDQANTYPLFTAQSRYHLMGQPLAQATVLSFPRSAWERPV